MKYKQQFMKSIFWILILIIFLLSYLLLIKIPHAGEDFALRATDIYHSASLYEIFQKIIIQMTNWNIRIGEQIAIIFSSLDKQIFNLVQAVMLSLYFYLYIVFITGKLKIKDYKKAIFILICSLFLVITFMPTLFEVFFWIAGSCNYFYALLIVLFFLLPYRLLLFGDKNIPDSKLLIVYTCIFGFFAGMSNENICISIFIMLFFTIIYRYLKKLFIPKWSIVGLVSSFLGLLVMLLAPSTRIRINYYNKAFNVQPGITKYFGRIVNVINNFFYSKEFLYLVIFIVVSFIIYLIYQKFILHHSLKKLFKLNNNLAIQGYFLLFAFLSVAALIGSPYVEKRSYIFFDTFLFMFCICLLLKIVSNHKLLTVVVSLVFMFISFSEYKLLKANINSFSNAFIKLDTEIKSNYYKGRKKVTVDYPVVVNNRYLNNRFDYFIWNKKAIKKYYKINVEFR